jgi:hypothetical protein
VAKISAREIVLYATNTGSLYDGHRRLAAETTGKGDAGKAPWERHVFVNVLPTYRRELRDSTVNASNAVVAEAAAELRRYYERHITE